MDIYINSIYCVLKEARLMKQINLPMLALAMLVIFMFVAVGIAISLQNIWLISIFSLAGFAIMGFGLSLKRRNNS